MLEQRNKIEQLERKIEELERKLQELPTKDAMINELETRLANYETDLRSDNGSLVLRKNFVLKNVRSRKRDSDNTASMYFNHRVPGMANFLIIGSEPTGGVAIGTLDIDRDINTSYVGITVKKDDNNPTEEVGANGTISILANHDTDKISGIQIADLKTFGIGDAQREGYLSILTADQRGDNDPVTGLAQMIDFNGALTNAICFHTRKNETTGSLYKQHLEQHVDILPKTLGGFTPSLGDSANGYSKLVLNSPDGSKWAVTINNSGTLIRTKL